MLLHLSPGRKPVTSQHLKEKLLSVISGGEWDLGSNLERDDISQPKSHNKENSVLQFRNILLMFNVLYEVGARKNLKHPLNIIYFKIPCKKTSGAGNFFADFEFQVIWQRQSLYIAVKMYVCGSSLSCALRAKTCQGQTESHTQIWAQYQGYLDADFKKRFLVLGLGSRQEQKKDYLGILPIWQIPSPPFGKRLFKLIFSWRKYRNFTGDLRDIFR